MRIMVVVLCESVSHGVENSMVMLLNKWQDLVALNDGKSSARLTSHSSIEHLNELTPFSLPFRIFILPHPYALFDCRTMRKFTLSLLHQNPAEITKKKKKSQNRKRKRIFRASQHFSFFFSKIPCAFRLIVQSNCEKKIFFFFDRDS